MTKDSYNTGFYQFNMIYVCVSWSLNHTKKYELILPINFHVFKN